MNLRRLGSCQRSNLRKTPTGALTWDQCRPLGSRALWVHHSSGQNSKELAIGNDLGRRGSLLVPPHKPHSIGCCDAQSTSATGRCCRKSPRHPTARNNRIIGLDFLNRTCAFENQYCSESPQNLFSTASVKGCLRDDVGCTSGIPQIADDLLHCPSCQSLPHAFHIKRSILLAGHNPIRG